MAYSVIVEGMDPRERAAFDRSLDPPARPVGPSEPAEAPLPPSRGTKQLMSLMRAQT